VDWEINRRGTLEDIISASTILNLVCDLVCIGPLFGLCGSVITFVKMDSIMFAKFLAM